MNSLFKDNYKIYQEKVRFYLSREIFNISSMRCCVESFKSVNPGEKVCPYRDTEDHIYSRRVSNALDEVIYICQMLCMPPVFLNSYSPSTLWNNHFSQSAYMKYHIENWYINVIRLEEMYLILLNEIFQLGIKKELVGYELIVTNSNLPQDIEINLKALHKACKHVRSARIMLMHHQTLFEEKLYDIERDERIVQILKEGCEKKELTEAMRDIEHFAKKFKSPIYRREKNNYMLESNQNLLKYISSMLLVLEKYYRAIHKKILDKRKKE